MTESALIEKLRTALDRTEEIARAAWTEPGHGEWRVTAGGGLAQGPYMMLEPHHVEGQLGSRGLAHIAHNGPAPVLRSVAAHRKIIAEFESASEWADTLRAQGDHGAAEPYARHAGTLLGVLRHIAAVYFPEETTE